MRLTHFEMVSQVAACFSFFFSYVFQLGTVLCVTAVKARVEQSCCIQLYSLLIVFRLIGNVFTILCFSVRFNKYVIGIGVLLYLKHINFNSLVLFYSDLTGQAKYIVSLVHNQFMVFSGIQ